MAKQLWKPGNMIYPLPAVMVSVTDGEGHDNIITVAWTGTVCTNPAMAYISVRPSRYSYDMIRKTGEFVINLTTEKLAFATDFCGVRSGRDVDKFRKLNLTKEKAQFVSAPMIGEAPVSIECRVREVKELGSHDMFLADVLAVHADEAYMDKNNRFCLNDAGLLVYSHGEYLAGGRKVGTFGYSVKKKQMQKKLDKKSDRESDSEAETPWHGGGPAPAAPQQPTGTPPATPPKPACCGARWWLRVRLRCSPLLRGQCLDLEFRAAGRCAGRPVGR